MDISHSLTAALKDAIEESVSGKDVAVAFSGGLDSGIVATISKEFASSVKLYTAGVKDAYDVLESESLAKVLGLEWEHVLISEEGFEASVKEMVDITGTVNPITLSFEIPLFYVSRAAKEVCMIGGQGADELFAGYSRYIGLSEEELRDTREADMARLFSETLSHESSVCGHFGKEMHYPYLDRRVVDIVDKMDMKDLMPGQIRKENLRKVAEILGQPEVAAKKKKAAQYGSGAMSLFRKIAKKRGLSVSDMVRGMKGDGE